MYSALVQMRSNAVTIYYMPIVLTNIIYYIDAAAGHFSRTGPGEMLTRHKIQFNPSHMHYMFHEFNIQAVNREQYSPTIVV